LKAQAKGEIEKALEAFEDAYEAFPANNIPLLLRGEALCHFGYFSRASQAIASITLSNLSPAEKARFFLIDSRIAIASQSWDKAEEAYKNVLKFQPENFSAKVGLSIAKDFLGSRDESIKAIEGIEVPANAVFRDIVNLFVMKLLHGNLIDAWENAFEIASRLGSVPFQGEEEPFLIDFWKNQVILFLGMIPLSFGNFFGAIYLVLLLGLLVFLNSQLIPEKSFKSDILFVILAFLHLEITWLLGSYGLRTSLLQGNFFSLSPIWIAPRILISMHFITLGLFIIFPIFRVLPEKMRPAKYELYSIWFFCFWFSVFVVVFQSALPLVRQLAIMILAFILMSSSALFMPMGRYLFFIFSGIFGLDGLMKTETLLGDGAGFTEAKIQETKALKLIEADDFDGTIAIARKVFGNFDKKTFPNLWLAFLKAHIEMEDFFEAERGIGEFLAVFKDSSLKDSGTLLAAYLKSLKGDHSGALGIIKSISDDQAKTFSAEQTALSLFILGRSNWNFSENVQAHIDFSKALSIGVVPLTKAKILTELAIMDLTMNRSEWVQKWFMEGLNLKGGAKTRTFFKILESVNNVGQKKMEEALAAAEEACKIFPNTSKAWGWRGHLLCLLDRKGEAENLLAKMNTETDEAEKLMSEITARRR